MPCVVASSENLIRLQEGVEANPSQLVEMNLASRTVSYGNEEILVDIPDGVREQLIQGTWDSLGQLIDANDQVTAKANMLPYTSNFSL